MRSQLRKIGLILLPVVASRLVLLLIGVASRLLLEPLRAEPFPWTYSSSVWLSIWGVWDSGWYLEIAVLGYSPQARVESAIAHQANYAFFPLYPLLMRWLGIVFGSPFIAGIVVSNACLLISCFLLYRLLEDVDGEETALRAVRFLLLFPTGFIFSGVFSESLFLALMLAAFVLVRRKNFIAATATGIAAALTRSPGALLVVPLAVEHLVRCRERGERPRPAALWLLLVPSGLAAFAYFNYSLTGDWFAFAHVQSTWGRHLQSPLAVLLGGFRSGEVSSIFASSLSVAVIVLLIGTWKRLEASFLVLSSCLMLLPLSTGLVSMPRYALVVFPVSIALARLTERRDVEVAAVLSMALLQGFLMAFWVNGFQIVM